MRREVNPMKHASARRYVRAVKGLYIHAIVYAAGSMAMAAINFFTGAPYWAVFPVAGWGLGVGIHAIAVLGPTRLFSRDWEAGKIREWRMRHRGALGAEQWLP